MTWLTRVALLAVLSAPAWSFNGARVEIDLEDLEGKAEEVVEVNLDGETLEQGSRLLAIRQGVSGSVKSFLRGIKGVYRRTYRFGMGKSYEDEDVQGFHEQMAEGGWSPVIDVKDNDSKEAVTVYSYSEGEQVTGVTVVSADSSEVTVVNIVGDVDLGTLSDIGASIGVPEMVIGSTELKKLQVDLPPPSSK